MNVMIVGLIGCGAIGKTIAKAIVNKKAGFCQLFGICDLEKNKVKQLKKELNDINLFITTDPHKLIENENIELIIEAASQRVITEYSEIILSEKNRDYI